MVLTPLKTVLLETTSMLLWIICRPHCEQEPLSTFLLDRIKWQEKCRVCVFFFFCLVGIFNLKCNNFNKPHTFPLENMLANLFIGLFTCH